MKTLLFHTAMMLLLCQCGLTRSINRADIGTWNENRIWKPVPGSQTDYVPAEYHARPSSDPAAGEWVQDPQDGMRFYIPAKGTRSYKPEILRAEAYKATNRYTHREQATVNTGKALLTPVHIATLGFHFWPEGSASSSPSNDEPWLDTSHHHNDQDKDRCKDRKHNHDKGKHDDKCKGDDKKRR